MLLSRICICHTAALFLLCSVTLPQSKVEADEFDGLYTAAPRHAALAEVPFTDVKFDDGFWTPKLNTNREATLPHIFEQCEKTGRIDNFAKAAKRKPGKFQGLRFNDSDVFKTIEGAAYSLATHPDAKLGKKIDAIIADIVASQLPDGYLNTSYTLGDLSKRWTCLERNHELYNAGTLFEAGVAYYQATGKRALLDAAVRNADHIDATFGPTKRAGVPGHPEIELALVRLYKATGKEKYLKLANYFIDARGAEAEQSGKTAGKYDQGHNTLRKQREAVGHAVRAMYLYCGAADTAAYSGDEEMIDALKRIWRDMVDKKIYITGGIGALYKGESFGKPYYLANEGAYCETCASIGLAFWAHRMNLLLGDAEYANVMEQTLYNGVISGASRDGKHFFYVNRLVSDGEKRGNVGFAHRQPFFRCACCPPNVLRLLPTLPGYMYAVGNGGVYVNLYAAGTAKTTVGRTGVSLTQKTKYPWDGRVELTVEPEKADEFAVCMRVPKWCKDAKIAINGQAVANPTVEKGYARLQRKWQPGDKIVLDMPMPVERIEANPNVEANIGRVAVRRGPIVYCFESTDNAVPVQDIELAADPRLKAEYRSDLLGGGMVVTGTAKDGRQLTAIPYHAWDNREPGEMAVWVRQSGKNETSADDRSWKGKLYRPYE